MEGFDATRLAGRSSSSQPVAASPLLLPPVALLLPLLPPPCARPEQALLIAPSTRESSVITFSGIMMLRSGALPRFRLLIEKALSALTWRVAVFEAV